MNTTDQDRATGEAVAQNAGINLAALAQAGLTDEQIAGACIAATNFDQLIASAKSGDADAARKLAGLAWSYLATDMFGPMPQELRRYIGGALADVSMGKPADVALNLKRNGAPRRSRQANLQVGHQIYAAMQAGSTLEGASFDLAEEIAGLLKKHERVFGFTLCPDFKTLQGIYAKVRKDIEGAYCDARIAREALTHQKPKGVSKVTAARAGAKIDPIALQEESPDVKNRRTRSQEF